MARLLSRNAFPILVAMSACSVAEPRATTASAGAILDCGSFSPIGNAVATAASNGPSSVPQPSLGANTVTSGPIIGGQAFADALVHLVASAQNEVIIESFLIDEGSWIAGRLRDAIAGLDPGLPVYVLVTTDRSWTKVVQGSPQDTANRVHTLLDPSNTRNVTVAAWSSGGTLNTEINHDKVVIVDRSRALVSNINMEDSADPTSTEPNGHSWYQLGVVLQGDVAAASAQEAASAWAHAGAIVASKGSGVQALPSMPTPPGSGCQPMIALGREAGDGEDSSADQGFRALFSAAQRIVRVQSPNLNDEGAIAGLVEATNHADVYVVLSKGFNEFEEWLGQGGGNAFVVNQRLPGMLSSAGNACRMHVRWYASENNPGKPVEGTYVDYASHAKYASADSQVMVLGSQNMDTQSWQTSRELSVAVDDPGVTQTFDSAFQAVWDRSACAFECGGCGGQTNTGPDQNWATVGCFVGEGTSNPQPIIDRCQTAIGAMPSGALSVLGAPILCADVLADNCYLTTDCPEGATTYCTDQVGMCVQDSLLACQSQ